MIVLFLGLTLANFACLITTGILGYAGGASTWHRLAGALAAIVCVGVHCVVFTYFVATGKWIEHAILVKRLDPTIALPVRTFKMSAFPAALGAMTLAIATAIVGAAVDNQYLSPAWHHVMAMLLVAGNLGAAFVEYRAIRDNGVVIDSILAQINATAQ